MLRLIDDICVSEKGRIVAVDRSTLIQNAQRFMARGQIDKAIEEWQKLVSVTPQDGNLYNTIGDLYLKKNDTHHAVETFLLAAAAFERAGFALKTIAVYKKILKVDPSNLDVNLKLADLNADRGLTGNAIEDYLKVAKEYGRAGKVQAALDIYRKIANFDPGNTNIRLKLAELSLREKLTTEAIDEYMKVAHIYEQNGRTTDAAGIYKKILEINPKHAEARDALKETVTPASPALPTVAEIEQAIAVEDWDMAGQKASVLLLHEPTNLTLRRLRGKVLLHKGEEGAAWADYRAVADEAIRSKQTDEAIQLLQEYVGVAPRQREPVELLASLFEQGRQIPEAIQTLASLVELMERDGVHESEVKECFLRMKALDPASEITARYQTRFEPPPAQAESDSVVPEDSMIDVASLGAEDAEVVAAGPAHSGRIQTEPEPFQQPEMVAAGGGPDEDAAPVALSDAELIQADVIEAGEAGKSGPMKPSSPPAEPSKSGRSVSMPSKGASISQRADVNKEGPSVSISRRTDTSQSRNRDQSAPSQPKPSKRIRPRDLPDYFAEADVYLKYGLAAKAIEQYQLILSIEANNIEAHSKLRELYQLEGRLEEAVTHSLSLARLYLTRGQRDEAEQIWAEAQEWSPDDPRLQGNLVEQIGAESRQPTRHGAAREPQDETVQRPKQDLQEWLAEAEFYLQQGLQEQAHDLFETIRHHYPDAPEVKAYFSAQPSSASAGRSAGNGLNDLANELGHSTGDDPPGQDDASLSRQLAELFPGAFRGMADAPQPAVPDRLTDSVEGVIRAVEQGGQPLPPEGPDPHYSLGLAYKEMGLYAEARKEFELAVTLPTYRMDAMLMIAACHEAERQPKLAASQVQQCLTSLTPDDPKWAEVAYESARLSAEIGETDKAVAVLQSLIRSDPTHMQAVNLLKTLQQSARSHGVKDDDMGKTRPPKQIEPAAEQQAGPDVEQKPDKNKRHRISYV